MEDRHKHSTLLESGTNELMLMEFRIGKNTYAINVLKVREIIEAQSLTPIPLSHPFIMGVSELRGKVIPIIDLAKALGKDHQNVGNCKWVITEMNQQVVAFQVDTVEQIHRLSWNDIEAPSTMLNNQEETIIGVVRLNENIALLLDFEKILTEINPSSGINEDRISKIEPKVERSKKHILLAEDSTFLSNLIRDTINKAGYQQVTLRPNGQEMWDFLESMVKSHGSDVLNEFHCLITDIEMPQMDGHHLTKRVKEHPILKSLPVVIFSSLITDDLRHKGETVGANAQVSKPEIDTLVDMLDSFLFK